MPLVATTINLTREGAVSVLAIPCRGRASLSIQVLPDTGHAVGWGTAVLGVEWSLSTREDYYEWVALNPQRAISGTTTKAGGEKAIPVYGATFARVVVVTADGTADAAATCLMDVL